MRVCTRYVTRNSYPPVVPHSESAMRVEVRRSSCFFRKIPNTTSVTSPQSTTWTSPTKWCIVNSCLLTNQRQLHRINVHVSPRRQLNVRQLNLKPHLGITRVAGKIKHHASLKPVMSDQYIARIRRRAAEANRPKKSIVMLEDRQDAGGSNLKMVQSGAIQTNAGFNLSVRTPISLLLPTYSHPHFLPAPEKTCSHS